MTPRSLVYKLLAVSEEIKTKTEATLHACQAPRALVKKIDGQK